MTDADEIDKVLYGPELAQLIAEMNRRGRFSYTDTISAFSDAVRDELGVSYEDLPDDLTVEDFARRANQMFRERA